MTVDDRRTWIVDLATALTAIAACVLLGLAGQRDWYWSAAIAATLALRRHRPLWFVGLAAGLSGLHLALRSGFLFPGDLVWVVAIRTISAYAPGRYRHVGLAIGAAGIAVVAGQLLNGYAVDDLVLPGVLVAATTLAAWSTGLIRRQQRTAVHEAENRRRLAERDSALRAQLAVHEERTRISREMHDIIAHSLSSIIAQAEGGRVAARADAAVAGPLFDHISRSGREALGDVKRLLTVIGRDDRDEPAVGLRDLPALLEGVAAAGLEVRVETTGCPRQLAAGMDLAVYRVIQESLTNVLKHAPRRPAELIMAWSPRMLTVTVANPLPAELQSREPVEGRGLSGIRQRCSLFDGDCVIRATARLTVTTTWPCPPEVG